MRIVAISDVHYKYAPSTEEDFSTNAAIISFVQSLCGDCDLLVLNGDIFDLWFDWKYCIIADFFPLLHALENLRESGSEIVFISGNHDFWFGDFFPKTMQIKLFPDRYTFEADGKKMLFTHGDLYTVNDMRYKIFRSLIRMRVIKSIFSILHPDLALKLGLQLSRSSRKRKISKELRAQKTKGLERFAATQINNTYDIVVMGHSHDPVLIPMGKGTYANCGDWIKHRSYIKIIDGIIGLYSFAPKSCT